MNYSLNFVLLKTFITNSFIHIISRFEWWFSLTMDKLQGFICLVFCFVYTCIHARPEGQSTHKLTINTTLSPTTICSTVKCCKKDDEFDKEEAKANKDATTIVILIFFPTTMLMYFFFRYFSEYCLGKIFKYS